MIFVCFHNFKSILASFSVSSSKLDFNMYSITDNGAGPGTVVAKKKQHNLTTIIIIITQKSTLASSEEDRVYF